MTRKEKLKKVFGILLKVFFIVGIIGVFASVLLDLFNRFEDYQNDNNSIVSINRRIDTSDINNNLVINVDNYDLINNDNVFTLNTNNANYDFNAQLTYTYIACVRYSVVLNAPFDLLMVNQYTWSQLLGTSTIGGTIQMNNNNVNIYDFYFSGVSTDLYLNIYFSTFSNYIINVGQTYDFNFGVGSSSRFTFDYTSVDLTFIFTQYNNNYVNQNAYTNGYNDGYRDGLDSQVQNGQEIYDNGYDLGYQLGYSDGLNDNTGANVFRNALLTIFDVPLMYVSSLLNFNLLGVNFFGVFSAIITISICLWILQKVI